MDNLSLMVYPASNSKIIVGWVKKSDTGWGNLVTKHFSLVIGNEGFDDFVFWIKHHDMIGQ